MKRIESREALRALQERWLRPGIVTNFFPEERRVASALETGTLYGCEEENAAVLLFREPLCDRVYLFTAGFAPISWRPERAATFEMAFRTEREEQAIARLTASMGFAPALRRLRLYRRAPSPEVQTEAAPCPEEEALAFLHRHFDPWFGCVPERLGQVLALQSGGCIVGLIHYDRAGNAAEIRHLAVEESFRGRGLASKLIEAMRADCGAAMTRVWVREENAAARRVYEKNGFQADGRRSLACLYRK